MIEKNELYDMVLEIVTKILDGYGIDTNQAQDMIMCRECGVRMKQITAKHLKLHNMTVKEYKRKWGIPLKRGLCSSAVRELRSMKSKSSRNYEKATAARLERRWDVIV